MSNSITCPVCSAISHNPHDIEEGYCGRCHRYTRIELDLDTFIPDRLVVPDQDHETVVSPWGKLGFTWQCITCGARPKTTSYRDKRSATQASEGHVLTEKRKRRQKAQASDAEPQH